MTFSCASTGGEPKIETQIFYVPTPVTCVPEGLKGPPQYVASKADIQNTAGPDDLLVLLGALVKQQWARLDEVESVVAKCR